MTFEARAATGRRTVALASFAAAAMLLLHGLLWDVVRYQNGRFVARPAELVAIGADNASLFRLALVADMFGDYLLLVPAVMYLWRSLRTRGGLFVDVVSAAGLTFAVVGAVGAAVLAAAGEPLIREYAHASPRAADEIAVVFGALIDAVIGVWQMAGGILLGVWLVGIGTLLRAQWPWFARFSLVLGVVALLGVAGVIIGLDYRSDPPATLAFLPFVVWIAWLGLLLWTRPGPRPIAASGAAIR